MNQKVHETQIGNVQNQGKAKTKFAAKSIAAPSLPSKKKPNGEMEPRTPLKRGHALSEIQKQNAPTEPAAIMGLKSTSLPPPEIESGGHRADEIHERAAPTLDQIIGTLQRYGGIYERYVSANTADLLRIKSLGRAHGMDGKAVDKWLKGLGHIVDEALAYLLEDSEGGHDLDEAQLRGALSDGKDDGHASIETHGKTAAEIGGQHVNETQNRGAPYAFVVVALPFAECLKIVGRHKDNWGKEIERLAKMLPVWPWVRDKVGGVGPLLLGRIVGGSGDLTAGKTVTIKYWRGNKKTGKHLERQIQSYMSPAKVWKRMGLGVTDGRADRRMRKHSVARDGLLQTPEENVLAAQMQGFPPKRRALMHVVGASVVRHHEGKYYDIYKEERRRQEEEKHPEFAKKAKAADPNTGKAKMVNMHPGHWHKNALRYAEKRILKDLWIEWNRLAGTLPPRPKFNGHVHAETQGSAAIIKGMK